MNVPPLKVLFAGTPGFAAEHLKALLASHHDVLGIVTQPDKPGKRGRTPVAGPVKTLAIEHGLALLQPERLGAADLSPFGADVMVVVAFGQILRRDVLALPRLGCVNVHASLLPRWRGAAPVQRAILAGDGRTGICTMQMDEGLDTGDVLVRHELEIQDTDTAATLGARLAELGAGTLIETLDLMAAGNAVATPQPADGATYARKITKHEAQIDWAMPAAHIDRQIRAFNPDPVAFSFAGDLRVRFWQAQPASGQGDPGEILALDQHGLEIACGSGSLLVARLQLPVGKGTVISVRDLLNAPRSELAAGRRFHQ